MIVDNACGSVHGHAHEHTISLHLPKAYELVDRDYVPMKKRNVQDSQHSSQLKQHLIKKKNGDIKIKPRKYIWTKGLIKGQRERGTGWKGSQRGLQTDKLLGRLLDR